MGSHPAWVCGLKHLFGVGNRATKSHTLRGCVDWNKYTPEAAGQEAVTPCVGVWIETSLSLKAEEQQKSHPAWVCGLKRKDKEDIANELMSHPAWVCGLKPSLSVYSLADTLSHPVWVCGLKHHNAFAYYSKIQSHPAWVCGLKPNFAI